MKKLSLQRITEELNNEDYYIPLVLGKGTVIWLTSNTNGKNSQNCLEVEHDQYRYSIPILDHQISLRSLNESIENAKKGTLEILVGTKEQVNKQLEEKRKLGKSFTSQVVVYDSKKELTKESIEEIKRDAFERIVENVEEEIIDYKEYLGDLKNFLTPELKGIFMERIDNSRNIDRDIIIDFDNDWERVEKIRDFIEIDSSLKFFSKVSNLLSFGSVEKRLKKRVDLYAQRVIAWTILEKSTNQDYKTLNDDSIYLGSIGEDDFAKQIRDVALFYGNISHKAQEGKNRMSALLTRAENIYCFQEQDKSAEVNLICSDLFKRMLKKNLEI